MFLNCVDKHSEMPQKSYFRMVMDPEIKFDGDGNQEGERERYIQKSTTSTDRTDSPLSPNVDRVLRQGSSILLSDLSAAAFRTQS